MSPSALRILMVSLSRNDPLGGASRVFHLLNEGLLARGHDVTTIHREDLFTDKEPGRVAGRVALPQVASRAAARLAPERYDVVFSASGMLYPLFGRMGAGKTLRVHHLLGAAFFDHRATMDEAARGHVAVSSTYRKLTGPLPTKWDLAGARAADLVTLNCRRDLDYMIDQGIPAERCRWIPLAVHPDLLAARSAASAFPPRMPRSAIWFGSWSDRKGTAYLVRAWAEVLARHPDATLTLGGTGMSEAALHAAFAGMDTSHIRVLGRVSIAEQVAAFERHELFLFPSLSEGFGFALLEAMACGLAAVTTTTGMGGDLIRPEHDALIVPAASATHLASAICRLFDNPALRERIAAQGRRTAEAYTLERLALAYEETFISYRDKAAR